jgi:hypothetical protein
VCWRGVLVKRVAARFYVRPLDLEVILHPVIAIGVEWHATYGHIIDDHPHIGVDPSQSHARRGVERNVLLVTPLHAADPDVGISQPVSSWAAAALV